ncbi:radical SAM protein [Enterobacteriaceae bacterium H4N4]|uniref:Radical SAM protein n=1 Tax=Silvania confinis TaxID=2926470 RepID=A0A9J6Q4P0_9ENTR|nr:radical SAM protein [Silvania confinis]MCU6667551.1 radical SAM protein [Silvania confinis]
MTGCHINAKTVVDRQNSLQPEQLYRALRAQGTPTLQFIPLLDHTKLDAVTDRQWGTFLSAVFDIWVWEDMGRVVVPLFDLTLAVWRGDLPASAQREHTALPPECQTCIARPLCNSEGQVQRTGGKSALCAGYLAFFSHSAPHMRVMRDLTRHHRSPMELMALLHQSR